MNNENKNDGGDQDRGNKEDKPASKAEEEFQGGDQKKAEGGENPPPPPQGGPYYYQPLPSIPNSTAVLVLGIISIVTCFCYGVPGLICGIIALVMSNNAFKEYNSNPNAYSITSYNNLNAGRVCAIIGVILSSLYFLWVIFVLVIYGSAVMSAAPWDTL